MSKHRLLAFTTANAIDDAIDDVKDAFREMSDLIYALNKVENAKAESWVKDQVNAMSRLLDGVLKPYDDRIAYHLRQAFDIERGAQREDD